MSDDEPTRGAALLARDEPPAFETLRRHGASPFVIVCDHAGQRIPRALGDLGVSEVQRRSHIAWDIGAGEVARRLGRQLDAPTVCQTYSRLVIDCNRPLAAPDSIAAISARTIIPGNEGLGPSEKRARACAVFYPYHDEIRALLDERRRLGRPSALVAVHSFTPVFEDRARPWGVGVLFHHDARLGKSLLGLLRDDATLVVGENQPYTADATSDYALIVHGEDRGIPCVELELRQDLIGDEHGQSAWAERLARLLPAALATLPS